MENKEFDIEYQYQQYLKRMKLSESTMHPQQKQQLREAFYGAWTQLIFMMRDDLPNESDERVYFILENMVKQTEKFWAKTLIDYSRKN